MPPWIFLVVLLYSSYGTPSHKGVSAMRRSTATFIWLIGCRQIQIVLLFFMSNFRETFMKDLKPDDVEPDVL